MTRFLANTKIMHKVLAVLLLLGTLTVGLTAALSWRVEQVDESYAGLVRRHLPATSQLIRMNRFATEMGRNGYRTIAFAVTSRQAQSAPQLIDDARNQALGALSKATELDPTLRSRATELGGTLSQIHRLTRDGAELVLAGNKEGGVRKLSLADEMVTKFGTAMVQLNSERMAQSDGLSDELAAETDAAVELSLITGLAGTLLGLGLAFLMVRSGITVPIAGLEDRMRQLAQGDTSSLVDGTGRKDEVGAMARALQVFREAAVERERLAAAKQKADDEQGRVVEVVAETLAAIAQGDLTKEITADFPPEYRELKGSVNQAVASLRTLLAGVSGGAVQIRIGSTEIAQASEDLAKRTESNAASLEETSAAIVQMDGRLKATASAAGETVVRADQAIATVAGGRSVADEAVQAMGRVSESARGIDGVIEGLDKIAFQTRVLAMNAAVEAGRAGEAGRGFAVVADLVSALAMRAEEEAKRARGQITVTQDDIGAAVEAVQRVDGALANISSDVTQVHHLLASIAGDNQDQATAITQISAAVAGMDRATQQNAAMVEETSAAARNLLGEVSALAEGAARFVVNRPAAQTIGTGAGRKQARELTASPVPRPKAAARA